MAYKDSGEIATNSNYTLGDYSFRIERSSVPGSSNDQITAICTQGGKNARKSIQVPSSTQIDGWYVEANETEASVYVQVEATPPVGIPLPVPYNTGSGNATSNVGGYENYEAPIICIANATSSNWQIMSASPTPGIAVYSGYKTYEQQEEYYEVPLSNTYTFLGKTVYYTLALPGDMGHDGWRQTYSFSPTPFSGNPNWGALAWYLCYGKGSDELLVGRFAIDLGDAGGVGPGSDWVDPGDYDPDWEEGDPTHTLYVTVTGALSGRHNDPIVDPSYSYIPSDKETVKDYGCGGDGGHGGGGGAGASTVVIHKFATNQANSKEVTAIARRHGYGSGGGKGGKGGDGCILVYY